MSWKALLIWNAYFLFLVSLTTANFHDFFSPDSQQYLFFSILCAFDITFFLKYFLTLLQLFFNLINLLPILFYLYRVPVFSPVFWQYLLVLRLIFDIAGHPFEMIEITAIFHSNILIAILVLSVKILIAIPSYVVCFLYAFRRDKIFSKNT